MSDAIGMDVSPLDKENVRPAIMIQVQSKQQPLLQFQPTSALNKSHHFELSNRNRTPETSELRKLSNAILSAAANPLLPSQSALHAAASAQLKQVPPPSAAIPAFHAPEPPAAWKIDPREIKRLDHLPPLGTGAYGTVYRASWHGLPVAVKELDASINDPQAYAEFKAEMDVWSSLRYPAIVSLYGAFTSPRLCLVMQYCKNGALSDHLHGDPNCEFGFDSILRIASQVASGLQYLHSRGVVHRDIKSFNVLLDEEGNARLSDFGLSVSMRREVMSRASSRATLTTASTVASLNASPVRMRQTHRLSAPPSPFSPHQVNVTPKREKHSLKRTPPAAALHSLPPQHSPSQIRTPRKADIMAKIPSPAALPVANCESENEGGGSAPADPYEHPGCGLPGSTLGPLGTYGFMSPELFTHGRYSPASDSYAFGCYLWEMVARAVPFGATPPIEIATSVVHGLRPPLPPHLPFEYRELIRACWSPRPEDRPTMEEILVRIANMQQEIAQEIQWEMQQEKSGRGAAQKNGTRRGDGSQPRPGKWLEASWVNAYEVSQPYCLFDGPPSTPSALDAAKYHSNPYFHQADGECDDEELNADNHDEDALRAIASNEAHLAEFGGHPPAYFELTPEDLAKLTASERAYYHAQQAIDMEEQREYIRAKLEQEKLQAKKDLKRRQAQKPSAASQDDDAAADEDALEDLDQPRYFQQALNRPRSRPEERAGRLMLTEDEMEQAASKEAGNGKSYFVPAHLLDSSQALSDTLDHSHTDGHNESAYWEQVRQEEARLTHLHNEAEASIFAQQMKHQQVELEQQQEKLQREASKQLQDAAWAASSSEAQCDSKQSKKLRQILVAAKPKSASESQDSNSSHQSEGVPSRISKQKRNEKLLARIAKMLEEDADSEAEEDQSIPSESMIRLKSHENLPSKPTTPLNPLTQRQLDELMLSPVDAMINSVLQETNDPSEQPRNLTPVIPLIPASSSIFNGDALPIASPLTLTNDSMLETAGAVNNSPQLWAEKVLKKPEVAPSSAPAAADSLSAAVLPSHSNATASDATVFVIPQPQVLTLRPCDPSADSASADRASSVTPVRGENLLAKQQHPRLVDSTTTTAANTPSVVVFHATSRSTTPPQSYNNDAVAVASSPSSLHPKDGAMPFMSPAQVADGTISPNSTGSLPLSCTPSGKEHTLSSLSPISRIDQLSTPQQLQGGTPIVSSETKLLSSFHSAAVPAPSMPITSTPRLQEEKQFDELSLPSPLPPLADTLFLAPSQPIHFMHQLQQQAKFHSAAQALTLAANQQAAAKLNVGGEGGDEEPTAVVKDAAAIASPTLNSTRFLTPLIGTQNRSEALLSAMNRSSTSAVQTSTAATSSTHSLDQEECKQPLRLPVHSIVGDALVNNQTLAIVPAAANDNSGSNDKLDLEVAHQKACCVIM